MKIYAAKDYADLSRKAANIISAQVIMKPNAVLGLATGSTPIGAYKQLIEWYEKGDIDFSHTLSINLDEYKGLSGESICSCSASAETDISALMSRAPLLRRKRISSH